MKLTFFVTRFLGAVRPRRLKLGTHVGSGQIYRVYWNKAAAAYSSLHFYIFLSLQFLNIICFVTLFSRTVRPIRLKPFVHTWTVWRCIVCTGIRLLLLICSFTSSVFFLSNFQTLKFFVTLFSGTVRP